MKKKILIVCVALLGLTIWLARPVSAISETQKSVISNHCETIRNNLKTLQHNDSRARVYLGRYYETILSKFITPLNVRLVENNLSNSELIDNQNNFAKAKTSFTIDFIEYQKKLESLVAMDCKNEPEKFYEALAKVRVWRETVENDVTRLNKLALEQVNLVNKLKEKL